MPSWGTCGPQMAHLDFVQHILIRAILTNSRVSCHESGERHTAMRFSGLTIGSVSGFLQQMDDWPNAAN